jgi:hypothetical protein
VLHTTETSVVPSYPPNTAPHFTVPDDELRIYQHVALGRISNSLRNPSGGVETNAWTRVQIEIVGFSSLRPWLPSTARQQTVLASLLEWCQRQLGIPERRVFRDRLKSGVIWATESNPRRREALTPDQPNWGGTAGWWGHVEVPENTHWDPGSLKASVLLGLEPQPRTRLRHQLVATKRILGHREIHELTGHLTLREIGTRLHNSNRLRDRIRRLEKNDWRVAVAHRRIAV